MLEICLRKLSIQLELLRKLERNAKREMDIHDIRVKLSTTSGNIHNVNYAIEKKYYYTNYKTGIVNTKEDYIKTLEGVIYRTDNFLESIAKEVYNAE